jgi:tetratricopeptide (TPR) repeat protein
LSAGQEHHPDATAAAQSLASAADASTAQTALAQRYLGFGVPAVDRQDATAGERAQRRVASLRAIVHREPRNSVRWVDLGREYLVLGLMDQTARCVRVALALAPENRFVLRSAAHFYVHVEDTRAAQRALDGAVKASDADPWLLSARLALRSGSVPVRAARQRLARGDLSAWHAGELAAALGTLELAAGKDRDGRALMRRSLVDPTENALAQAVWIGQQTGVEVDFAAREYPQRPYEALARSFEKDLRWQETCEAAEQWLADQPFSLDAASSTCMNALRLGDYERARDAATAGLRANTDATLLNNRAFAKAQVGDWEGAVGDLMRLNHTGADAVTRCCAAATGGLVLFRAGQPDSGRARYFEAIDGLHRLRKPHLVARAAAHLAFEERAAGTSNAEGAARHAWELLEKANDAETHEVCCRLLSADTGLQQVLIATSASHR